MKLKYAKSKLGRIEFKYQENMSYRGDGKLWNQDYIEAYLDGKQVGYLKIDYIKPDTFFKVLPNKEAFSEYFGKMGHTYPEKELAKKYKDFYYHWVDSPLVDYIRVKTEYQRHGIGYALYIAGAMWMADKKMCLHASTIQSDEAQSAWEKMKKIGLPIGKYKNQAGEERSCLDYRGERGFAKKIMKEMEGNEPHTYYHITFDKYLKNIKRYGIKPREKAEWNGMAGQDIRQHRGVFVFDNYYDALMWAFKTSWARKGEKIWILKIRTGDTDFVPDTHWESSGALGKWLVKQSPVDPDQIVEYIPFDIAKWNPELTKKINDLRAKRV